MRGVHNATFVYRKSFKKVSFKQTTHETENDLRYVAET